MVAIYPDLTDGLFFFLSLAPIVFGCFGFGDIFLTLEAADGWLDRLGARKAAVTFEPRNAEGSLPRYLWATVAVATSGVASLPPCIPCKQPCLCQSEDDARTPEQKAVAL